MDREYLVDGGCWMLDAGPPGPRGWVVVVALAVVVVVVVHEERCARAVWALGISGCKILPLGVEAGTDQLRDVQCRTFFTSLHVSATFFREP